MIDELRTFIRHPSSIPIQFKLRGATESKSLKDVSKGGVCFESINALPIGESIQIQISSCTPDFEFEGIVRWCKPQGDHYLIGVAFRDKAVQFAVRMVEQICHIENYRKQVMAKTGTQISSEQAAQEWISQYAGQFPTICD